MYYPSESRSFHDGIFRASLECLHGSYLVVVVVITQYHLYWVLFILRLNSLSRACSYLDFNSPIIGLLTVVKSANSLAVISICSLVVSSRKWSLTLNMGMKCFRTPFRATIWRVSWREGFRVNFLIASLDIKNSYQSLCPDMPIMLRLEPSAEWWQARIFLQSQGCMRRTPCCNSSG